ncbi:hypothetical protein EJB05_49523 [Eragrostis curvula]|uniref:Uncharacterized protein n=1 Tax=Eragrostis curvula TaxID=38414 RepID=A0A5J9T4J8_9POAL|nr:hypothetical protein EJB05_49523 [Eragrostis curvula]
MPLCDEVPVFHYRLIDYVGNSFLIGAGGGSVFHLISGLRNPLDGDRLAGAILAVWTNVPRVAGRYGAFGALLCIFQTAVARARRRDEDHWASIVGAAAASSLFVARQGATVAAGAALLGATYATGFAALDVYLDRRMASWKTQRYRPLRAPVAVVTEGEKDRFEGHQFLLYGEKFEVTPEDMWDHNNGITREDADMDATMLRGRRGRGGLDQQPDDLVPLKPRRMGLTSSLDPVVVRLGEVEEGVEEVVNAGGAREEAVIVDFIHIKW